MTGLGDAASSVSAVAAPAARGDIVSSVVATGNLEESVTDVSAPYEVVIDSVLVTAGDDVARGDAVALLDKSSLANRISGVKDDLDEVNDAIDDLVSGDEDSVYVRSRVTARVKGIYVGEGDVLGEKTATDGALMLLSLDGLMAVDLSSETELQRGDEVTVTLADGSEKDGTVESAADGAYTVTLTDNGPAVGEKVSVSSGDEKVGEGELYVHEPLKVTYGEGEVASVSVDENDKVYNGTALIKVSKSSVDTGFASLTARRDALAALLESLSALATDRTIYAPVSGTVDTVAAEEGQALTTTSSALTTSESAIVTIAARDSMALGVDIDELDVAAIRPGLETEVEIDAIEGETFHGSVVEVSDEADVETGVAKYGAVIEIERSDAMKAGMSATATITKEKREGVITIPMDAIQEFGDRVFVYTGIDAASGAPTGEADIETGLSDGVNVEIVSGLNEGDVVYYLPPAASGDEEAQQMGFPGMMGGGGSVRVEGGGPPGGETRTYRSGGGGSSGGGAGGAPSFGGSPD